MLTLDKVFGGLGTRFVRSAMLLRDVRNKLN